MQMVASSFESVAGHSATSPYVSLALNTVSRNFRCLRNAISDQLKHVTKVLGEDLLLTNAIASSSRGDTSTSRFRYMDQSFQKQKYGEANAGFFEPQQQVYRPQRGLPEQSVAILRAWLFNHFLHPYPTDTEKHMLATQTGLETSTILLMEWIWVVLSCFMDLLVDVLEQCFYSPMNILKSWKMHDKLSGILLI